MKSKILLLMSLLLSASVFQACNKADTLAPAVNTPANTIPAVLNDFKLDGLALPNGTKTVVDMGGARVRLLLPAGISYLKAGQYKMTKPAGRLIEEGSYTCTGQCSKGCDVFYVQESFACSQCSNGAACTGKSGNFTDDGGFVDVRAGVSFLANQQEARTLQRNGLQAPKNLLAYEFVREALRAMNQQVHGTDDPSQAIAANPQNYRHVAVNIFGYVADYAVPLAFLEREAARQNDKSKNNSKLTYKDIFFVAAPAKNGTAAREKEDDSSSFSCSCVSGSSGCTADSGLGYKVCKSGSCDSCKMTVS